MEVRMRVDGKRHLSPHSYMLLCVLLAGNICHPESPTEVKTKWRTCEVSWSSQWELLDFIWRAGPQKLNVSEEELIHSRRQLPEPGEITLAGVPNWNLEQTCSLLWSLSITDTDLGYLHPQAPKKLEHSHSDRYLGGISQHTKIKPGVPREFLN